MDPSTQTRLHKIATFLIGLRYAVVGLFLAITAFMLWAMFQLQIETGFKKQLPLKHEYMITFEEYEQDFGGANRVLVSLMAKDGQMFTEEFFTAFEDITNQVFFIPGVDRASVRSIFTPNVRFVEIVEDGFAGGNVIPSDFAPSPEAFETVRSNIVKSGEVGRLVASDFSGAMVWANLLEENPTNAASFGVHGRGEDAYYYDRSLPDPGPEARAQFAARRAAMRATLRLSSPD